MTRLLLSATGTTVIAIDTLQCREMVEEGNGTEVDPVQSSYQPASVHHDELMAIYVWPFALVVIYTILGTIGNVVVLYIYIFRWKKTKTRIFIIALAIFNFVNSVFNMPVEAYILWHPLQFDNHWLCKITRGVTFIINNVCACIFVAIAIDRMLLVYKPFKRIAYTVLYAKRACLIAFAVGTLTSWPGLVFYGTATLPEILESVVVLGKTCYVSDYYMKEENVKWPTLFNNILFALMIAVYVLLAGMYILIGRKIYRVTKCDLDEKRIRNKRISKNKSILQSIRGIAVGSIFHKTLKQNRANKFQNEPAEQVQPAEEDVRSISFDDTETHGQSRSDAKEVPAEARRGVARMSRRISSINSQASRGNTITMLLITVAYMISFLPYVIIVSLRSYDKNYYYDLNQSQKIAYHIFLRTYFLNSVINPMLYSFTNKEFRGIVKVIVYRIKCVLMRK